TNNISLPITVNDGTDQISRNFNLKISAVQITTSGALPNGTVNVPYSQTISASGGTGPYTFSLGGNFPQGLGISSAGVLSGSPSNDGSFSFNITVNDSASHSYTKLMVA